MNKRNFAEELAALHALRVERLMQNDTSGIDPSRVRLAGAAATYFSGERVTQGNIAGSDAVRLLHIFVPEVERRTYITDARHERVHRGTLRKSDHAACSRVLHESVSRWLGLRLYRDHGSYVREEDLELPRHRDHREITRGPHAEVSYYVITGPDMPPVMAHYDRIAAVDDDPFENSLGVVGKIMDGPNGRDGVRILQDPEMNLILNIMQQLPLQDSAQMISNL